MSTGFLRYAPAVVLLGTGAAGQVIGTPQPTPLSKPLTTSVPDVFAGIKGADHLIAPDEVKASGVTDYLSRTYDVGNPAGPLELYVGYHATQQGEYHMHSPEVCLPGSGWLPEASAVVPVSVPGGQVSVNRYILRKGDARILVYYWFQGRGRVTPGWTRFSTASFIDGLKYHRDEEALVRVIVPLGAKDPAAPVGTPPVLPDSLAHRMIATAVPELHQAFPAAPK